MNKNKYVLVLNCGSSSVKFAVIDPDLGINVIFGIVQRIGTDEASLTFNFNELKTVEQLGIINYENAIDHIFLKIKGLEEVVNSLVAIGHRVVHGGEKFAHSVLIDEKVLNAIIECEHLAPLHNPANLVGIYSAMKAFSNLPNVAVFDTAFHQTMPARAYIYAIPYEMYSDHGFRRYGFHGTSHMYVAKEAAKRLNKTLESCSLITAHLGNGCSIAAVLNGHSVDTSMGLTPLEGLVMGTRSGDIDPSLVHFFTNNLKIDVNEAIEILNKKSGLLGISEKYSDMRSIESAIEFGDKQAELAMDVFCYRLAKYIASYTVPLNKLDALVFTGGIGENSTEVRKRVIKMLMNIGFELDEQKNNNHGANSSGVITKDNSVCAIVVPTNEELCIARDAIALT